MNLFVSNFWPKLSKCSFGKAYKMKTLNISQKFFFTVIDKSGGYLKTGPPKTLTGSGDQDVSAKKLVYDTRFL